jgi:asparagine synthase (glutamine-hydrolysing)
MCGIAGIVALDDGAAPPERQALERMAGALWYRGPDEFGLYRDDRAGLAHARLAIIDLATGQQPMADEAGTTWIAFNGEVFNYLELRAELSGLGMRFRTTSDTEVLLNAYLAWGERAFTRINGQWALGIWEASARRLVLARDPFGICPLYLCQHGGYLYFASEVKAIFAASGAIPRALDVRGIDQTFTFWSVVPPQGVFRGVGELEPGHVRSYQDGRIHDRAALRLEFPRADRPQMRFAGSLDEAVGEVGRALETATSLRVLRADVPVGSYLSGGLDSSLVAALGRQHAGRRFQTFSLRFDDAEYDESQYQRLMAQHLGSEHHEVCVSRADIAAVFPEVVYHAERPILRTAPAPLYLLSRLVQRHGIKVVLTGEGADEVFGGYDIFREGKVRRFWGRVPDSAWRFALLERLYPYLARSPTSQRAVARAFFGHGLRDHRAPGFAHAPRWRSTAALKRLLSRSVRAATQNEDEVGKFVGSLPAEFGSWSPLAQDQFIEMRTLLAGYLLSSQGDRMLLGHSVEGRFPFLDREVVALASSLPDRFKLHVLDEKHILKRIAGERVPAAIRERKKQPYRAPDALAFVGADVPDYVEEALSEREVSQAGVFEPTAVRQLLMKCRARAAAGQFSNFDNMALVGVLSTQLVHRQLIAAQPVGRGGLAFRTDVDHTSACGRGGTAARIGEA